MIERFQNGKKVYSDGETIEEEILNIAKTYKEEEIPSVIAKDSRYLINNTFSLVRRNLLEWYPFRKNCSILEVGAGMGPLTGLLCEKAIHVTSVEMSQSRAEVVRERWKNKHNLTVICDDILSFEVSEQYDYVVMVGVLEYAAIFDDSETPFIDFLEKLKSLLKPDGVLLFAIENQFGLKYWIGGSEEHLQRPFLGIQGYQQEKTAKTFSKAALEKMCRQIGFDSRFYYLLPDYRFPTAIFTDQSLPTYHDVEFLRYSYAMFSCLTANEKELYRDIIQNNVFPFFANAYLVEAGRDLPTRQIIRVSARSEVVLENRIVTAIDNEGYVYKIPQTKEAGQHIENTYRNEEALVKRGVRCIRSAYNGHQLKSPFCHDRMANDVFAEALEEGDFETVKQMIDAMESALRASSDLCGEACWNEALTAIGGAQGEAVLEHGYMDMTFYNAFWSNGDLIFFDQEWDFHGIPLRFILYYGLKICYGQTLSKPQIPFTWICSYIHVSEDLALSYDKLESLLWGKSSLRDGDIYGEDHCYNQYGVRTFEQLVNEHNQLGEMYHQLQADHTRLSADKAELSDAYDRITAEHTKLISEKKELSGAYDRLIADHTQLADTHNRLITENENLENAFQQLTITNCQITAEYEKLQDDHCQMLVERTELKKELSCMEGECQRLRDRESQLQNDMDAIKNCRTWRLARFFVSIVRFFVPIGSKRALCCRLIWNLFRHPIIFFRNLTPRKIKKALRMLRRNDIEGIKLLMQGKITGEPAPSTLVVEKPEIETIDNREKTIIDYPVLQVPMVEHPLVSIIIPAYNHFEFTYHCIRSILRNSGDIDYEILVADDCSTDLTEEIGKIIHGVRHIRNKENLCFLRNCNYAAKEAKGKYILFLNNDTQVQANWLRPLVTLIESADDVGLVGSKLIYPDGLLQEAGGILWRDGSVWNYGNRQNPNLPEFNYVKQVDYISGASIMLSRTLWEEIGGFDETFAPAYCEDSDLCFTVRKMGYRVMYQPLSVVVHFEGITNGTDITSGQKKYQIENLRKFREKWKDELVKHPENGENVFQARDYSYDRKTVVMIDHYVPMYDKDAGSRTIYQYVKLLVDMGYNVKFIGDNFYEHQPYTTELEQMGVEVLYGVEYMRNWKMWVSDNKENIHFVFMNRPHISEKYIDFFRKKTKAKIIYNLCDLHFLREQREYEVTGDESLRESAIAWKSRELALVKKADRVFSLSIDEKKILDQYVPPEKTVICPIFIFDKFVEKLPERKDAEDLLFVGGFSHHPNVDAVRWFCAEIFPLIQDKLPDVKLHIVGSNPPPEIQKLRSDHVILEGFVSDEKLDELYRQCRVCVIPLRYGAGVKGKTIEAMYHGIPIVTTSIGIEGLPDIEKCLTAHDGAREFAEEVVRIYRSADDSSIQRCYKFVREHYSLESAKRFFAEEFK